MSGTSINPYEQALFVLDNRKSGCMVALTHSQCLYVTPHSGSSAAIWLQVSSNHSAGFVRNVRASPS